jgi:UDP-N-acetylmuramate dehydrogenase
LYKKIIDFSKYTSIRVGGLSEVSIIETEEDIKSLSDFKIIGGGNNILVSPQNIQKLALLSKDFDFINIQDDKVFIGGSTKNRKIFNFAKTNNLHGFEFMANLPSTLGGMIKMNAGLKEFQIFDNLLAIRTQNGWIEKKDIVFGYRHTEIDGVILEAVFQRKIGFSSQLTSLFREMRSNQPKNPSAGSTFKNPKGFSAGKLIQEVGLKGFKIGDMAFSNIHANFLVNLGRGTFEDSLNLLFEAERRVFENFGVQLEKEVCLID